MNSYRKHYPQSPLTGAEAALKYIRMKRKVTNRLLISVTPVDEIIVDHHHTWAMWEELIEFRSKIMLLNFFTKRDLSWYNTLIDEFKMCPPSPLP